MAVPTGGRETAGATVGGTGPDVDADGGEPGTVVGVVTGAPVGTVHTAVPPVAVCGYVGTVPVVAPAASRATSDAPVRVSEPLLASTTSPSVGAIESSTDPVADTRRTAATWAPTSAATQSAGPPSALPNDPAARTPSDPVGGTPVGRAVTAVATARSVDSSTVTDWHP